MATTTREAALDALFDLLCTAAEFPTASRRLQFWGDVVDQPALFLRHVHDRIDRPNIILRRLTIEAEIWIFSRSGAEPMVAPDIELNTLVEAVEAVLAPDDSARGTQTLGGLVQHCWIEGQADYDPGDADSQSKARIPVRILVP